jgi:NADH:ubiquinone oxidoreductase subunit 4 (subunit M)
MRETATLLPLAFMIFWVGLYPDPLMEAMDASVLNLIARTSGVSVE